MHSCLYTKINSFLAVLGQFCRQALMTYYVPGIRHTLSQFSQQTLQSRVTPSDKRGEPVLRRGSGTGRASGSELPVSPHPPNLTFLICHLKL